MPPRPDVETTWNDLFAALRFVEEQFARWQREGALRPEQLKSIDGFTGPQRARWEQARHAGLPVLADTGLRPPPARETAAGTACRYWKFLEKEIARLADANLLTLAQRHDLTAEARERQGAVQKARDAEEVADVVPAEPEPAPEPPDAPPAAAARPRRNLLEILLDPRNIQWLLAFGGALIVVGLVILLYVNNIFTPLVVAITLGVVNAALLAAGWWLLRSTRYQIAGRAVTLMACLVMPLNLWYYHANHLITLDGHLWAAALVISVLYAASAWALRDELFVYVFVGGITLTGLLLLADLPPSPQKFWEIAAPATLLVVLGLLCLHAERAFADQEGPFSRRRFGLAFFWSGHALLAAGLLLVLGAEVAGDWLYEPVFKPLYQKWQAGPSPIVGELRWLALCLVAAGTYAYTYSDLVVRRKGVYVHVAAFTLMWALVLAIQVAHLALGVDALIAVLALTALAINVVQATALRDSPYTHAFPLLGALLPGLAVVVGVVTCLRAISLDLKSVWKAEAPTWSFVGAMALTAVSCRVGAYLYRGGKPRLTAGYFFAAGAATLVACTAALAALKLESWHQHAPWLMLLPIAYLVASRLNRGGSAEQPLYWVAQTAAVVLLISSLASAVEGFTHIVEKQPLNLSLAVFFAEAAVFYGLTALWRAPFGAIHLCAACACGTVWQLLTYAGVEGEYYTLTFALVGLALLIGYRFALVKQLATGRPAAEAFEVANTLLSLSFVAAVLMGLSRLATHDIHWAFVGLSALLGLMSLAALVLVRQPAWRRWYMVTSVGMALLTFLGMTVLSRLTPWQKLEIFCVLAGLLLLGVGHVGWYREQDRHNDVVSQCLLLGSLLVGVPLAVAALIDRSRDDFIVLNELGFLLAGVLLLTTGFLFRLKSTTLVGAGLTALYFVTLLIRLPWSRMSAVALFIIAGGGVLFGLGLVLSVYRDRLLTMPDRIKQRQGVFRVLNWR